MSNIVGENHLPYVQDQIKVRQQILGKKQKSSQDIVWENSRTSWVRLVSSVDIDGQEVPRYDKETNEDYIEFSFEGASFREQYLELSSDDYSGNRLAKELVLEGGTSINNKLRFGITNSTSTLPGIQNSQGDGPAAYGLGGNEFGIKPMPGIIGFSSNTYNNGSLRKADLQVIAHNKKQFEYIESLYLRLGYSMLLEWGNTVYPKQYIDSNAEYSTPGDISQLSLKEEFLDGRDKGVEYFYTQIEELRKNSKGNYDGFLGKVVNFSWEFTKEGSYLITINLISIGSVIESLKLNTSIENINYPTPDLSSTSNSNTLPPLNLLRLDGTRPTALEVYLDICSDYSSNLGLLAGQDLEAAGNTPVYKSFLSEAQKKALGGYEPTSAIGCRVAFGKNSNIVSNAYNSRKNYIRFGELLNFINKTLLIYDKDKKALFSIDVNENLYCYSNGWQFPSDPSKMMIRFENAINDKTKIEILSLLPTFHDKVKDVSVGRVMNLYFSTDFIKEAIKNNTDDENGLNLYNFIKKFLNTANTLLGGVNKLDLRITEKSFTETTFEAVGEAQSNTSTSGSVEDDLLVNTSQFQEATFTTSNVVKQVIEIYDEVQPFGKDKLLLNPTENPPINIYGFSNNLTEGNFVTDYSFQTTLSKNFSTQVSIGAQANGRAVGEDSTVFSKWNIGLVDRILPVKLDLNEVELQGASNRVDWKNLVTEYKSALLKLATARYDSNADAENATALAQTKTTIFQFPDIEILSTNGEVLFSSNFTKIQNEFFSKMLSYDAITKNTSSPFVGFLPVNLSVTLDGLSGVRIFDKLKVNADFLPSNYGETLEFIITQLDHKFEGNKWFTTLGTLSIPKLTEEVEVRLDEIIPEIIEEPVERETNSLIFDSYFYSDHIAITGGRGKVVTVDEILKGLNASPEVQFKFGQFLDQLIPLLGNGYEIRINSSYRNYGNSYNVYKSRTLTDPAKIFRKTLRSPHSYGLALDIALYEIADTPGSSTNLLAGFGSQYLSTWNDLKVVDLAKNNGLRWGGTFTNNDGSIYPDGVHFDALDRNTYSWPNMATTISKQLLEDYPNIQFHVLKSYKNNLSQPAFINSISVKDYVVLDKGNITYSSKIR